MRRTSLRSALKRAPISYEKSKRSTAYYKSSSAAKQRYADKMQFIVADIVDGEVTPGNQPFDVLIPETRDAIEVKTLVDNKNSKITMHKESRIRKERFARKNLLKPHTVAIDARQNFSENWQEAEFSSPDKVFYKKGVGSYYIRSMRPVTPSQLREAVRSKPRRLIARTS